MSTYGQAKYNMCGIRRRKNILILFGLLAVVWILYCFEDTLATIDIRHSISDFRTQLCMTLNDVCNKFETYDDAHALPVDRRLFQSIEEQEFPSPSGNKGQIPHIIHQIYTDDRIPQILAPLIQSCVRKNPSWKYMFWTHTTGKTLISRRHPYLLDAYNSFTSNNGVKKNDLLRWVVLYEFGGIYADMDVECLRPLDKATNSYTCIVPLEPFEHAAFFYNKPYFLNVGILLCQPRHPFVKFVLMHLGNATDKGNPVAVTGPEFITNMFQAYNQIEMQERYSIKTDMNSNSPSLYKGIRKERDKDAVYIPNSQYFMDTINQRCRTQVEHSCFNNSKTLPDLQRRACLEYTSRENIRRSQKFTFTVHHWFRLWTYGTHTVHALETVPIRIIVPDSVIYQ